MTLATHAIMGVAAVLLFVAGIIAVARIAHGPSQLDRSAAADLTVAVVIAAVGLWTAYSGQSTEINILLLLSMLGFTSAVGVARLVSDRIVSRRNFVRLHRDPTDPTDPADQADPADPQSSGDAGPGRDGAS